uniref:GATA-type domain-containing protein n=1 Tax=Mycena chlorophos TaxID=658473 RepID=A0ABQ0LTG1_MYCCL|nr:predicted protein [Mycena chlorophos]
MPFRSSKHEEQLLWRASSNTGNEQVPVGHIRTHPLGSRHLGVVGHSHQPSRPRGTMPPIPNPNPNHILDVNGGPDDVVDWPSTQQTRQPDTHVKLVPLPPSLSSALARRELGNGGPPSFDGLHLGAAQAFLRNAVAAREYWVPQHVSQAPMFPDGARPYPVAGSGFGDVLPTHDPRWRPCLRSFPLVNGVAPNMALIDDVRVPDGNEMVPSDSRLAPTIARGHAPAQLTDEDWAPFCAMWLATAHLYAHVEVALDVSVHPQFRSKQEYEPEDDHATTNEFPEGSSRDHEYSHTGVDVTFSGNMVGDEHVLNAAAMGHMAPAFFANALGLEFSVHVPPPQSVAHAHAHPQPRRQRPHPRPSVGGPARDHSHAAECPSCGRVPTDADLGEWRMGIVSREMVCNACGQYERRTGRVRPRELEKMRRRGNGLRVYKPVKIGLK